MILFLRFYLCLHMQQIKNISSKLIAILTVVAFFFSTTGFTLHKNNCDYEGEQIGLTIIDDCCEKEIVQEVSDGGAVESRCSPVQEESDCCEDDQSYHKLSNSFVQPEKEKTDINWIQQAIIIKDLEIIEREESIPVSPDYNTHKKKPDRNKYRLYHRVKLDPALI